MVIFYILAGLFSGVFGGMGMGGGTALIPILTIFLGVGQKMAQGVNLLAFVVMAIFSLVIHIRNGFVYTKGLFVIILGGLFFSCLGAFAAVNMPSNILRIVFAIFLCFLAILEFFKVFKSKK